MAVEVEIQQVDHTFQDKTGALTALRQVDLRVAPGEFVSLVGPSGCGKSTLLRLVAGLIAPSRGQIWLAGQPAAALRSQKEIGWMAQQSALLPWRTVLDNVRLSSLVNRQAARPAPSPEELLALVGLADFAGYYPAALSGGMQQRAALARMLATGASLWLMDEPFAALDELTRESLGGELLRIWSRFRPTVLWVTHHLPEAVRLSDRVVMMSRRPGRIQAEIPIALPRPRDDTGPEFQAIVRQARAEIMNGEA